MVILQSASAITEMTVADSEVKACTFRTPAFSSTLPVVHVAEVGIAAVTPSKLAKKSPVDEKTAKLLPRGTGVVCGVLAVNAIW
jgi:hypothetical protein